MAITSRADLKEYILRRLGKPVIQINIADEQLEDRLSDAFQVYGDYHFDATQKEYVKHQVTAADLTNKYVPVGDNIVGITKIYPLDDGVISENMFDIRYQMALNDFFDFSAIELTNYFTTRQHISLIKEIINGSTPIRYSRHTNKLFLDTNWKQIKENSYLLYECVKILDPEEFTKVYNDRWLKEYATSLTKMQWGQNLSKYQGIQLPGGNTLDGQRLITEAQEEIRRLEDELSLKYEEPVDFYMH